MMEMLDHTADVGSEPGPPTHKVHFDEETSEAREDAAEVIEVTQGSGWWPGAEAAR